MPSYDYACADCGEFTQQRPMAESAEPCDCPHCGAPSPRAFLVMPALFGMDAGQRRALGINEESRHAPRTVEQFKAAKARHPAGCGCCAAPKGKTLRRADGATSFPSARPWMISH